MMQQVETMQQSCSGRGLHVTVRMSMLELQGRKLSDLLSQDPAHPPISIRDSDTSKHPSIYGAEEMAVSSSAEMLDVFNLGLSRLHGSAAGGEHQTSGSPTEAADDAGSSSCLPCADSRESSKIGIPFRHPDSHLVISFNILLQGMRSVMPTPCPTPGKPPPPPPIPKPVLTANSLPPPGVATLNSEVHTSTALQPQEECVARATIRIVDLNIPPCAPVDGAIHNGDTHIPESTQLGCGEADVPECSTTPLQRIPTGPHVQCLPSDGGSAETAFPPINGANISGGHSHHSPSVAADDTHHWTLQTSSRRLRPQQPTPAKVASIASGGEPRGDILQAAQVGGLVPSPQPAYACSSDGLSGFEALERAVDSSTHSLAVMRYRCDSMILNMSLWLVYVVSLSLCLQVLYYSEVSAVLHGVVTFL
jgi:hypothetical protein